MSRTALALTLFALVVVADPHISLFLPLDTGIGLVGPAFADDDGGDDGDDDGAARDDRASDRMKSDRTRAKGKARRATPASISQRPPDRVPDEIVVSGLSDADLVGLLGEGFVVIDALSIARSGPVLHRLQVPDDLSLEMARDRVRARATGSNADFNHYFRASQTVTPAASDAFPIIRSPSCAHLNCRVLDQISWPLSRPSHCQATTEIGVIDTSVNLEHAGLEKAQIEFIRLSDADLLASGETHGTSVVALLVGTEARAPGLLPEARIVAVDIFAREGGDERADVVHLVQALDLLAARSVRIVNLSLAGPENTVLSDMLAAVEKAGMLVVAAVGNAGPTSPPSWPAAEEMVLAVTAVDANDRIYRRAQRGMHVDVAAPGVEVWSAASEKGVKPRTGTSYAAPFATAAAALLLSRDPLMTPAAVVAKLRIMTRDLGATGTDEVYGAGVLMLSALCERMNP